ncbi:MAG: hypothetical protein KYX68_13375 [Flavobacterium sp.]|nr:hypothetical protein [Flavobacterium sp.]
MIISHFYDCPSCKAKNKVSVDADDRGQLQMKKGEEIDYTCNSCHKKEKIHINKIYAEPSKIIYLSAFVLSVILTILFWNFGFIATVSFALPMLVFLYQQSLARNFNNYRIRK